MAEALQTFKLLNVQTCYIPFSAKAYINLFTASLLACNSYGRPSHSVLPEQWTSIGRNLCEGYLQLRVSP